MYAARALAEEGVSIALGTYGSSECSVAAPALEEAGIRPEDVNLSVASRVEHGPIFTASDEGDVYQEAGNG